MKRRFFLGLPLSMERGGQSYYYHNDRRGFLRALTDGAGTVINAYDHDSYGRIEALSETVNNPYLYTARELDPES